MPRSLPDRTSASMLALASIAALTVPAAALPNAAPSLPDTVPSFVGEAAEISVADFAYALAEARISAGFVGAYSDIFKERGFQRSATVWRDRSREDQREIPLEAAINIFRSRQPRYDVETREGLL